MKAIWDSEYDSYTDSIYKGHTIREWVEIIQGKEGENAE